MESKGVIICTDGIFPFAVGGMQRHSRYLVEELAKEKLFTTYVIHPHPAGIFKDFPNVIEVPVPRIDTSKNYLLESYKYSKRVFNAISKLPRIPVYSQGFSIWYNASKISSRLIINPHGLEPFQALTVKDKLIAIPFKIIFSSLFRKAAKVVSLGGRLTGILNDILGNKSSKIIVIPNAARPSQTTVIQKTASPVTRFLFVGRFASNKGIDLLLQVVEDLNSQGFSDKSHFTLVGKGPLYESLQRKYPLPNVTFTGSLNDEELTNAYCSSDALVFPTLFEGMPTVVIEAMSHGLPIIVSDVGATAELVDSSNGYLIQKNNRRELMNAIKNFITLPEEKKMQMSLAGKEKFVQRFTWERVGQEHLRLLRSYFNE